MTEDDYLQEIDAAIALASKKMEMVDVADDPEEEQEAVYEERFHCGTCITRTVMETVWPSVEKYIDFLKESKSEQNG